MPPDWNTTHFAAVVFSPDSDGFVLSVFSSWLTFVSVPWRLPSPPSRLSTNTSRLPFVSPGVRLEAAESKAMKPTVRPSCENVVLSLAPSADEPAALASARPPTGDWISVSFTAAPAAAGAARAATSAAIPVRRESVMSIFFPEVAGP